MPPSRFKRKRSDRVRSVCVALLVLLSLIICSIISQPQISKARTSRTQIAQAETTAYTSLDSARDIARPAGNANWLQLGDRSAKVRQLKAQLQQLGYETGDRSRLFNSTTQQAVLQFQENAGIGVDGIVGEETQRALAQAMNTAEDTITSASNYDLNRSQNPPDIERILSRGKLIVAVLNKENPPFFMTDESGQLVGADIVLAKEIAAQLGVPVEFNRSAKTFNDVVQQVYDLEADIAISKISRTLQRTKNVSFSRPYLTMRQGLLINRVQFTQQSKGKNVAETLRTLEGKVGVIRGSSYVGFVKQKFPQATVAEFSTWPEVVKAVTQGDVLAAYRDELEVKKIVRNNPDAALQFQTVALTDTQDPLSVVLPWDSRTLQSFVDQYLEVMHPQDTVDTLLDRYIEQA